MVTYAQQWDRILAAHRQARQLGSRGPLPSQVEPGVMYVPQAATARIGVALADTPEDAWNKLRVETEGMLTRQGAVWFEGRRRTLIEQSPILSLAGSPINSGRAPTLRGPDWDRVPNEPGVYRMHLFDEGGEPCGYAGLSWRLRDRLRTHNHLAGRQWGLGPNGIGKVELLVARQQSGDVVWTRDALLAKERDQIKKMRKAGIRMLNQSSGGEGPRVAMAPHVAVWAADPSTERGEGDRRRFFDRVLERLRR